MQKIELFLYEYEYEDNFLIYSYMYSIIINNHTKHTNL